jgi:predicted Zn-dependent peptidase
MKLAPGCKPGETIVAFDQAMAELQGHTLSPGAWKALQSQLQTRFRKNQNDDFQLALQLATFQVLTGDWKNFYRQEHRIAALKPADLDQLAAKISATQQCWVATWEAPKHGADER